MTAQGGHDATAVQNARSVQAAQAVRNAADVQHEGHAKVLAGLRAWHVARRQRNDGRFPVHDRAPCVDAVVLADRSGPAAAYRRAPGRRHLLQARGIPRAVQLAVLRDLSWQIFYLSLLVQCPLSVL